MAFSNHEPEERSEQFDIGTTNDRRIIDEFEKELAPYEGKKVTVLKGFGKFERVLTGFELYLHDNGIFRYSTVYPLGAFIQDKLPEHRFLKLKMQALDRLRESRKKARGHEDDRTKSLVKDVETLMQGVRVNEAVVV